MYYREISAARTELAQGTEAKVRTQNFRKAPRQCDRSLHKEPRQCDRSLRKKPLLSLRGVAPYNALSAGTESAYFLRSDKIGVKAVICLVLVFLWTLKTEQLFCFVDINNDMV